MIKENQKYFNRLLVVLDIAAVVISLILSWYLRFRSGIMYASDSEFIHFNDYFVPIVFILPVYLILYSALKLYTPYRFKTVYQEFIDIIKANFVAILIFIMALYVFKLVHYSRYLLFMFPIITVITTVIERFTLRFILHRIRTKGYNQKHIVIIGCNKLTQEFLNRIQENDHWGYNVLAILSEEELDKNHVSFEEIAASVSAGAETQFTVASLNELEYYLNNFTVDEVFITLKTKHYDKLGGVIELCEKTGVRTQIIPDYYKYIPAKPYVEELDGLPVINIRYIPLNNVLNSFIKRTIDILVSLSAILVFSPFMVITALLIKITSPGDIIFKQERVGLNRKNFMMYKFRSMKVQPKDEEETEWTTANDPRKTKFGNFIRKTSIDELPQLFNVLKGDMSIIGPRPERPFFVEKFKEEVPKYMVKHQVRPGMTGWAQVNGWRGDTSIVKRIECDIYYIENWSFWLDVKIIGLTVIKGFVNKNAY